MIVEIGGYKYFHGDLEVWRDGTLDRVIQDKDFFFDPNIAKGVWIYDDDFPIKGLDPSCYCVKLDSSCCVPRPYIPFEEERCGYGSMAISMGVCPVDPCVYEIVEKHKNVTVEVAKCRKCGHVELSWYKGDAFDDEKYSEDGASY